MREDKVLGKIHQTQAQLRKKYKGFSWDKEVKVISKVVKRVARKYGYRIFPLAKEPHVLSKLRS